jgi:Ca2+-binding EF-hand superfamily protein
MDVDGDGILHVDEFEEGLHKLGLEMSILEIKILIANINKDGDNEISFDELQVRVEPGVVLT